MIKKRNLSIAITLIIVIAISVIAQAVRGWQEAEEENRHYPLTTSITAPPFDELRPHETVPMPIAPHPFATALKEYMADYDGVVRAYLATLDDDGTVGVLTTSPLTRVREWVDYESGVYVYVYGSSGTLFYIQDSELFQIDASGVFVSGRYNRLMERLFAHTHVVEIIYKLEFGRLEISTMLSYFSDEYLLALQFDTWYGFHGLGGFSDEDYALAAEFIAYRDARAEYAQEKYGLVALLPPNLGNMRNTQDQTTQILAMTINCVPDLAAATTSTQTDQISVTIGDIPVNFAVGQPTLVDGRILVPVELFDVLGFRVTWQPQTQRVGLGGEIGIGITLNGDVFTTDNKIIVTALNGDVFSTGEKQSHTLDVPAQVIDGSTMVPIVILESVGYNVQWDVTAQTVIITNSN